MDSSESLQLDEHLARLLAAFDQGIDGGDARAQTISVTHVDQPSEPLPGEEFVKPLSGFVANEGSVGDLLPDSNRPPAPAVLRPPVDPPAPPSGPHRVGRFELRRQLGKGGCGIVFLAYDPKLEREVALKIPRPEMLLSPEARRRLIREALAAAEFDHPNLVPVYETGEIGPICFIATAFCPGQTLGHWLDKQAFPIPVRQVARFIATIGEAIQHAHDRGVLHRDLKPNNVILHPTKDDPNEQEPPPGSCQLRNEQFIPRVVDFGLAKLLERGGPSETNTRQILGTPKYMAPEQAQARHDDVGPPADVYALGVILYEMLTGRAPYEGATDVEVLRQSIDGHLTHPRQLRSDIPRDLEAICLKAMDTSPGKRYRTAIDLADDLRRFLDGKPTIARPLKWPGRAVRWLRRNDQVVALAVLTTIVAVLLAVGAWYIRRNQQLRSDQDRVAKEQAERVRGDQQREYARYLRDAFLAWRNGNWKAAIDAREAAQRLTSTGGEAPDFALRYLATLMAAERLHIVCPAGSVTALAVSADGKRLASGHADGTLAVWDRTTGGPLTSLKAHDSEITHLAFAGSRLLSLGAVRDSTPSVLSWTVADDGTMSPTRDQQHILARGATCFDLSADGNTVYIGTENGALQIVNPATSGGNHSVPILPGDSITAVAISPDGKEVLVGTNRGRVVRLNAELKPTDTERTYPGPIMALLPNCPLGGYTVGSAEGIFVLPPVGHAWSLRTRDRLSWMARLPDGGTVANDGTGRVTFLASSRYSLATGDTGAVRAGTTARHGNTLFTAGEDGVIRSWDLNEDLRDRAARSATTPLAISIHPLGLRVAVSAPHSFRDYYGTKQETHLAIGERGLAALRVPNEGATIGVEFRERAVVLLETHASNAEEKARFQLPNEAYPVSADFSADGLRLAIGDDRGRVFVWDLPDRSLLATIDCGHRSPIRRVALSEDGKHVAAPAGSMLGVWAIEAPAVRITINAEEQSVFRFLPGGEWLLSSGRGGIVRVWAVADGREEQMMLGHIGGVTALGASPDGRTIVSGGATGDVKFWDRRTGQELLGFRRHAGPVSVIEFAANGGLMVTGGQGQLAFWEARE